MNHPTPQHPNPSDPSRTGPSQPGLLLPDPELTLRLLAQLPPPDGLADRVHRRLQAAPLPASFWSQWMPMRRLQFAGAAAVVLALGFSSWTIYENRQHATHAPAAAQSPAPQSPAAQPTSGLTPAGAERHPASLKPIKVPPVPKKKPSAAKSRAAKPTPNPPPN
jgi:hypothetical protein